jgi:type I restriction enzyme S subunit
MIDAIVAGVHESATLANLRSALLPKLMSGEIRVRNTEQFMEELSA